MVVKQTLPGMSRFRYWFTTVIFVLVILSCDILRTVSCVQYCWKGTEDDLSGWKNQSCITGKTTLGNSFSAKLLPDHDEGNSGGPPLSENFHCMAFKSFETIQQSDGTSVKTFSVEYSCDFENACMGKDLNEGFKFERNGTEGMLYCCSDANNCNNHTMIQREQHTHRCYKAQSDGTTHTLTLESCPTTDTYCLMVSKHENAVDQRLKVVSESYSCDAMGMCAEKGLTDSQDKACKTYKDPAPNRETEICCCRGDTCFTPKWIGDGTAHTAQNPSTQTNGIQRTILIGIGIAIGLLVATVAIFIAVRYRKNAKANQKHDINDKMVYSAVSEGEDMRDADNVNILSRA